MKSVRYDSEARAEFLDAVRWYARRNVVAARRFDEHVVAAEAAIRDAPHEWPLVRGVPRELNVRRRLIDGYRSKIRALTSSAGIPLDSPARKRSARRVISAAQA